MGFHRLQRFPNLALNSLERLETMLIEFHAPDYLYKVVLRSLWGSTGSRGSPIRP